MCLADNAGPNSLAVQQDGASMKRRISPLQAMVIAGICAAFSAAFTSAAQETQPAPSEEADPEAVPDLEDAPDTVVAAVALLTLVSAIDEEATVTPTGATFDVDGTPLTLVFDVNADRMRLFSQVGPSDGLSRSQLLRLMQANFDTALDARYAIAAGQVWATYMHPMVSLTEDDFVSAIAQTVTLVRTYGTTFSSGALSFGAGDSNAEIQKLLEGLLGDETDI
jgi:hypothetical protein